MARKILLSVLLAAAILLLIFVPKANKEPLDTGGRLPPDASVGQAPAEKLVFGLLLVGPYNDRGYSQAHYDGGRYVEEHLSGARMIYIDKVNPADRPGTTIPLLVDDLIEKGATLIIANSDDMKDGIRHAAALHPDRHFVHISGDDVLTGKAPPNLMNLFTRIEFGKMMAGFCAAMTTRTGKIGYLGPLINEETRRVASASYLGAKHAWETIRGMPPGSLSFKVTWIGFWFNIPGVTADPTQVAQNFFNAGYDVVISGIDTTEALSVAKQQRMAGREAWAMPYEYAGACEGASDVCLGIPYSNWGPGFLSLARESLSGKWASQWLWLGPEWSRINDADTSSVGFIRGPALQPETGEQLDLFIRELASKKLKLFKGPLNYQDGSPFLGKGETATDKQIWYMEQLLEGMTGQSRAD